MTEPTVVTETRDAVRVITLTRPAARNAINRATATALADAVRAFEHDATAAVGVLHGAGGHFCAGLDLKALASEDHDSASRFEADGDAPTGPARLQPSKPLIAAVEGYATAGGLELALFCDLRVVSPGTVFGVFCRRWGIPLLDGGTVRLPRLIGQSRAMDIILTGRPVTGTEAFEIGLANRLVAPATTLEAAIQLATEIARFPQTAVRYDHRSVRDQWGHSVEAALRNEFEAVQTVLDGDVRAGAERFAAGRGRHGSFEDFDELA